VIGDCTSNQSPVTSNQLPITSHQSSVAKKIKNQIHSYLWGVNTGRQCIVTFELTCCANEIASVCFVPRNDRKKVIASELSFPYEIRKHRIIHYLGLSCIFGGKFSFYPSLMTGCKDANPRLYITSAVFLI
jgi:hypothetical protein